MDRRIVALAARQHGVVGRRQLLALGLPEGTVDSLVRSGRLESVIRGVYRIPGAPATPESELVAAVLRCGPEARVAGERLLALTGLREARRDGPFVVLTRLGRRVRGVPWAVRTNPVDVDMHAATVAGIAAVRPIRSLVEAAVDVQDPVLERLVHGCRWRGGILPRFARVAASMPHHPGVVRLLESGLLDDGAPESPRESVLEQVLAGLGGRPQCWVTPSIRVDLYFPAARLVIEYDGRGTHEGPSARESDGGRDAALRALGIAVLRLTAADLRDPVALRRRIEDLLRVLTA